MKRDRQADRKGEARKEKDRQPTKQIVRKAGRDRQAGNRTDSKGSRERGRQARRDAGRQVFNQRVSRPNNNSSAFLSGIQPSIQPVKEASRRSDTKTLRGTNGQTRRRAHRETNQ